MYQCFLTLPSVRFGKVYDPHQRDRDGEGQGESFFTSAILLHEVPASLNSFRRFSSAGVQGVLVLVFLAGGADEPSAAASEAWLGPPGSPGAPSDETGSGADALGSIFRFLVDEGEPGGGGRATVEEEVSWFGEAIAGNVSSFRPSIAGCAGRIFCGVRGDG